MKSEKTVLVKRTDTEHEGGLSWLLLTENTHTHTHSHTHTHTHSLTLTYTHTPRHTQGGGMVEPEARWGRSEAAGSAP